MRKLLVTVALVLANTVLLPVNSAYARPAYCDAALERCVSSSGGNGGVIAGCAIGYLFCG